MKIVNSFLVSKSDFEKNNGFLLNEVTIKNKDKNNKKQQQYITSKVFIVDMSNEKNTSVFINDANIIEEKNKEIIEYNTNILIELATIYKKENINLDDIKKKIIDDFNNKNLALYYNMCNDELDDKMLNYLLYNLNIELFELGKTIKLYKPFGKITQICMGNYSILYNSSRLIDDNKIEIPINNVLEETSNYDLECINLGENKTIKKLKLNDFNKYTSEYIKSMFNDILINFYSTDLDRLLTILIDKPSIYNSLKIIYKMPPYCNNFLDQITEEKRKKKFISCGNLLRKI